MASLASIEENKYLNSFKVTASADNALAVASVPGVAGKSHYITSVAASYCSAKTGLLQIKDGTTVIFEQFIVNADNIIFPVPLKGTPGNAVSAELAASGTAGVLGKVNLVGFTL